MPLGRTACLLVIAAGAALLLPPAPGAIQKTSWQDAIARLVRLLARGADDVAGSLVEAGIEVWKE